jgi:tetratricopeptide (TPR) repeat protein
VSVLDRALDPEDWAANFNVIESQVAQRKFAAADSSLAILAANIENPGPVRSMRIRVAFARMDLDSVVSLAEGGLSERPFFASYLCTVALYRGQLGSAEGCPTEFVRRDASLGRRIFLGDSSAVVDDLPPLEEILTQFPEDAYGPVIATLIEVDRFGDAKALLAEWVRRAGVEDPVYQRDIGLAAGAIAMAEGRPDSAARAYLAYNRSGFLTSVHEYARGLPEAADAFHRAGQADSAIAYYEAALDWPIFGNSAFLDGALWYPIALRRLGELYEARGDRAKALDYYQRFTDLWKDADPELQPQVADVRARIAALAGEPGG